MRKLCLALLTTLAVSAAHADDKLACQEFDIGSTGEFREQHLVDADMSGAKSAGDRLVGQRDLVDASGNKVGVRHYVGLIKEVTADGKEWRRTTELINVLQDGAIHGTKELINGKFKTTEIIGGTGAYVGVTGSEKSSVKDGLTTYHFKLNCNEPDPS